MLHASGWEHDRIPWAASEKKIDDLQYIQQCVYCCMDYHDRVLPANLRHFLFAWFDLGIFHV